MEKLLIKRGTHGSHALPILLMLSIFIASCSKNDPSPDIGTPYLTDGMFESIESQTISYGKFDNNKVELFTPTDNENTNRPLILLSPGGAWRKFSYLTELEALCKNLAARGYVVGILKYAIDPSGWTTPDEFTELFIYGMYDQKAAIRFFKKNATDYGIDAENIFLGGWSTGAHLTLATAYWDEDEIDNFQADQKPFVKTALETHGLDGDQNLGGSSEVKGTLLLMPMALEYETFDSDEPVMMMIHHQEAIDANDTKNIGNYPVAMGDYSAVWGGADIINSRVKDLGILDTYIRPTFVPSSPPEYYANLDPMSSKYYDDIAEFFYDNL